MMSVKLGLDGGHPQLGSWLTSDKITARMTTSRLTAMVEVIRCNKHTETTMMLQTLIVIKKD